MMRKHYRQALRKVTQVLAAGLLLQAGGCSLDAETAFGGLLASIASSLLSDFVSGFFNLV